MKKIVALSLTDINIQSTTGMIYVRAEFSVRMPTSRMEDIGAVYQDIYNLLAKLEVEVDARTLEQDIKPD